MNLGFEIGNKDAKALSEALVHNTTLAYLNLQSKHFFLSCWRYSFNFFVENQIGIGVQNKLQSTDS